MEKTLTGRGCEDVLLLAARSSTLSCKARNPNVVPRLRLHFFQSGMRHRRIHGKHVLDDRKAGVLFAVVYVITLQYSFHVSPRDGFPFYEH